MSQTLFLEAFGQLSRDTSLAGIVSEAEEDLYSVFNARANLMSWATTASHRRRVEIWDMNEAELTAGTDASRIPGLSAAQPSWPPCLMMPWALPKSLRTTSRKAGPDAISSTTYPVTPVTRPSASLWRIGSTCFALIILVNSATSMSGCCSRSTLQT